MYKTKGSNFSASVSPDKRVGNVSFVGKLDLPKNEEDMIMDSQRTKHYVEVDNEYDQFSARID